MRLFISRLNLFGKIVQRLMLKFIKSVSNITDLIKANQSLLNSADLGRKNDDNPSYFNLDTTVFCILAGGVTWTMITI